MSRFIRTPAFVLKTSNYSETSLIVTLYTLKEGRVRCIGKGARRPKSPFAGMLEPLNEIEVVYVLGRSELYTLKECSMLRSSIGLREDLANIRSALHVLALVEETQTMSDPNPEVFALIEKCLDAIEETSDPGRVVLFFRTKLLEVSGYAPDYSMCALCGSRLGKRAGYSPIQNGFICLKCGSKNESHGVSAGTMEILRRFQKLTLSSARRIKLSATQQKEAERLFSWMFQSILERKSDTDRILDSMGEP